MSWSAKAVAIAAAALVVGGAAPTREVTVSVTGMRSAKGVVRACMTSNEARFPKCAGDAASYRLVVPAATTLKLTFKNVTPGRYAIALLHDENNNGKADRALGMMPKEGFGFSRDAPVRMAPPKYADAVFPVGDGDVSLTIKMRYML
ncbi:hypothetical protein A6F68_00556 [Tsuneonella dongtanensis]|uniref:DUF2141 domain-containing protein n=1 Tax=Tsuneonella dongtanensis TaxID=692370 RepID=A0A1B2AAG2_9SPHN|nr:DUF2141 domain-containing protein [Tsuneonella dongtanensis]ANY19091.1 hypothetical protein A6F68_00556 [Tsuneonella dongtanensis]